MITARAWLVPSPREANVEQIINSAHGTVEITSTTGSGTTIEIQLPAADIVVAQPFVVEVEALWVGGDEREGTILAVDDMDGTTLCDQLQQMHPTMQVLFMSGYTAGHLGDLGPDRSLALLSKPLERDALLAAVDAEIQRPRPGAQEHEADARPVRTERLQCHARRSSLNGEVHRVPQRWS